MRLIDADKFQDGLYKRMEQGELSFDAFQVMVDMLDVQPTAYDVDKVVEQLKKKAEEAKEYWGKHDDECAFGEMNTYCNAVKIVKSGGEESDR